MRTAVLGFGAAERLYLTRLLQLAADTPPFAQLVLDMTAAQALVVDASDAVAVQLVEATERLAESVFIGEPVPAGVGARLSRAELPALLQALGRIGAPAAQRSAAGVIVLGMQRQPLVMPTAHPAVVPAFVGPPAPPCALLVDDSAVALRFLAGRLAAWGVRSDSASDSGAALLRLAARSYDLVFVDLELGPASPLDGLALCRHIKDEALAIEANVVMVSAHHSHTDRARGALAGCDAYLAKPLTDTELAPVLRRYRLLAPQPRA